MKLINNNLYLNAVPLTYFFVPVLEGIRVVLCIF